MAAVTEEYPYRNSDAAVVYGRLSGTYSWDGLDSPESLSDDLEVWFLDPRSCDDA
jgi:hypothetical protein